MQNYEFGKIEKATLPNSSAHMFGNFSNESSGYNTL